jgi:membrane associated rhomboid family serine protease
MFVPFHDGVPMRNLRAPFVTCAVIVLCGLVYGLLALNGRPATETAIAAGFGLIPSVLFGTAQLPADLAQAPVWATLITNIFIHAGLAHLVGNMLFLWVFGDNVEDAMGHLRFVLFFIACGVAGSLAHALVNASSEQPLVGASGAIAGVIAAYVILYPRVRIWGLAFKFVPLRIPAYWAIAAWFGLQVVQAWLAHDSTIGWWAHIGGFVAGVLLTPLLVRRGTPLFGRDRIAVSRHI